jgi:hypothetical protein
MTKAGKRFSVVHRNNNNQHHTIRTPRSKVGFRKEIDLDVGRYQDETHLRGRCHPLLVKKSSCDYRPPDYKPSWDPEEPCVMCLEKAGLRYMPVRFKNEETGLLEIWHYECLQAMLDAAEWIKGHEARTKDFLEEELEEEVAV